MAGTQGILPAVPVLPAVGDIPDGVLPAVGIGEILALDDAAAGEPDKCGLHVGQHLCQVHAYAVAALLPGYLRE